MPNVSPIIESLKKCCNSCFNIGWEGVKTFFLDNPSDFCLSICCWIWTKICLCSVNFWDLWACHYMMCGTLMRNTKTDELGSKVICCVMNVKTINIILKSHTPLSVNSAFITKHKAHAPSLWINPMTFLLIVSQSSSSSSIRLKTFKNNFLFNFCGLLKAYCPCRDEMSCNSATSGTSIATDRMH